ncbi:MAG: J domain-containing protein [Dehalococcoidia bacterium]|jgi:molecular chaperone DnaJ
MARDYYETLGIGRSANPKEVRQAYRRLARKLHPDVNPGDKNAEGRFKEVNAAYEVLSDPEKRKKYDRYGDRWEMADQIEEAQRHARTRAGPRGGQYYTFDFGDGSARANRSEAFEFSDAPGMENLFDLFRGGGPSRRTRQQPRATEAPVEISLDEAYTGTARVFEINSQERCPTCGGSGEVAGAVCHTCQGQGAVMKPHRIEAKIPPGIADGARVRIRGDSIGDVYLHVKIRPNERFERRGDDLYTEVDVPLSVAVLGGEACVQTLKGEVALTIPKLTQNGKTFRLRGLGMPHHNGNSKRGDLYAKAKVVLPQKLSAKEEKLFEELKALGA